MLEEHVTAEVGLEAGLGIRLRDGESNLAGGAEEDLAELAVANTTHARMMWMRRLWSAAAAVVQHGWTRGPGRSRHRNQNPWPDNTCLTVFHIHNG